MSDPTSKPQPTTADALRAIDGGEPPHKAPHRWSPEAASAAGRKGGGAPRRPKGLGKKGKRR